MWLGETFIKTRYTLGRDCSMVAGRCLTCDCVIPKTQAGALKHLLVLWRKNSMMSDNIGFACRELNKCQNPIKKCMGK